MRDWNKAAWRELNLNIAADARLAATDYTDDQIWQLSTQLGDPPAISLNTTYGLRARAMRMYPRFVQGDDELSDPASFDKPPFLRSYYPNYLQLEFSPIQGIDVQMEVWVPDSHAISGRMRVKNTSTQAQDLRCDWVVQLSPHDGERMAPTEFGTTSVLVGQSEGLSPVVFITSGAHIVSSPYPALLCDCQLDPQESHTFLWVHAAKINPQVSFELTQQIAALSWEAEIARVEMINSNLLEIRTGEPKWDLAFALSQNIANGLFVGPTNKLPFPNPMQTRLPDQGYSLRGDGSDYNHLWNGCTPLEAYFISGLLLPGGAERVKNLVRNFISVQEEDGFIDLKPGLAGQRIGLFATPIIASIAWQAFLYDEDIGFIEQIFAPLLAFINRWFTNVYDRDGDGLPEWDHILQIGLEEHPVFSAWHSWSQSVTISTAESPALCALLYQECQALLKMAEIIGDKGAIQSLTSHVEKLSSLLKIGWDGSGYLYWDRDTHFSPTAERLGERIGSGEIELNREFGTPVRLQIRIHTDQATRPRPTMIIRGHDTQGIENIEIPGSEHVRWSPDKGVLTTKGVFTKLGTVQVSDITPGDRVSVYVAGYNCQDISLLAPLWAAIPSQQEAGQVVSGRVLNRGGFWREFGLPICPDAVDPAIDKSCSTINLIWNSLIGEGLLAYGYRSEAVSLVTQLMSAITASLDRTGQLRRSYDAETGAGYGEINALDGLAPLGLFLKTLGLQIFSPEKILLTGLNPFPWPITVKYRGLSVLCQSEKTTVVFPDGQTASITDDKTQTVALEKNGR
jgi:hypothetical protein